MRSPHSFIVRPEGGKLFDNVGNGIILSSSTEDHEFTNRIAVVEEVPIGYSGPVQKGYRIVTHHNTFRPFNNMRGVEEMPSTFVKSDVYFIDPESIYMYANPGDDWTAMDPNVFVRPVEKKHEFLLLPGELEPLHGVMVYGPSPGTPVVFTPHSEYEFRINGDTLYKMKLSDICLVSKKEY